MILLGLLAPLAFAGSERLDGFRFRACPPGACVALDASEARRSPISAGYVFRRARVRIRPTRGRAIAFEAQSGYYDPEVGFLVLHGRPGGLVNLSTGKVTLIRGSTPRRLLTHRAN